ncbi:putative glycosyl, partial [Golovinomyces cichoracearum]
RRYHKSSSKFRNQPSYQTANYTKPKKCWVCYREGCFSTKHPKSERDKKLDDYRGQIRNLGRKPNDTKIRQHLAQIEGKQFDSEEDENKDEEIIIETLLSQMDLLDDDDLPKKS